MADSILKVLDGQEVLKDIETDLNGTTHRHKHIVKGGAKGATTPADITSSSIDADHQGMDVKLFGTTKWSALGSAVTLILGADVAPTLKGLANNANKLGSEFDNSLAANRAQYADFELLCRGASAMTAGAVLKLWLVEALDGTNYEDGDDSVTPGRFPDEQFTVRAVATAQRITVRGVVLPPTKFKPLIRNESGQALTSTDAENLLIMRVYSEVLG